MARDNQVFQTRMRLLERGRKKLNEAYLGMTRKGGPLEDIPEDDEPPEDEPEADDGDEMADFIVEEDYVDEDGVPMRRSKTTKKKHRTAPGVPHTAFDDAVGIFGDVDELLEARRVVLKENEVRPRIIEDEADPTLLDEHYMTERDNHIRAVDNPERMQVEMTMDMEVMMNILVGLLGHMEDMGEDDVEAHTTTEMVGTLTGMIHGIVEVGIRQQL